MTNEFDNPNIVTMRKDHYEFLKERAERSWELEDESKRLHSALEGLGKAVEIYSGLPLDEALKEAIELAKGDAG